MAVCGVISSPDKPPPEELITKAKNTRHYRVVSVSISEVRYVIISSGELSESCIYFLAFLGSLPAGSLLVRVDTVTNFVTDEKA